MKITILGAAGVRMPLMIQAIARRQAKLGLTELSLMDIDAERLELIGRLTAPLESSGELNFHIIRTTDAKTALSNADYVLTTFRVGGMQARVVDERVPLSYGILGQETTGPGGFAMAMRTIPVLLDYINQMRQYCPRAWLINFANPSGLLAEAALRVAGWERTVGICDAPSSMQRIAAALLGAKDNEVFLDYFGLNHLGWVRGVISQGKDYLPDFLQQLQTGSLPFDLPFDKAFLRSLGLLPNEYLFYYYSTLQAVSNLRRAKQTRGEQLLELNDKLFADLTRLRENVPGMQARYQAYLDERGATYMKTETGGQISPPQEAPAANTAGPEGYTGVALDMIEALSGIRPRTLTLNILNQGSVDGMDDMDVVEIPALVDEDSVVPAEVGDIPLHCLDLMQQVKEYERLTIEAATTGSYACALQALSIHPLVADEALARKILDDYIARHGNLFPKLD